MPHSARSATLFITTALAVSGLTASATMAHPRYMKKETVTSCGYCHTKDAGGGARNYRGIYYQAHADTFAGFDDAAAAKAAMVEIGPHAEMTPASGPLPAAPAVDPKSPLMDAWQKAHSAEAAYDKAMGDPELRNLYVAALAAYEHLTATSTELPPAKRNTDTVILSQHVLAYAPRNLTAIKDLSAAQEAITAAASPPK